MKMIGLQNPEYICINHQGQNSYGGSQTWFSMDKWMSREYVLHKWGCGVIAMADLLLYLSKENHMYATGATSLARGNYPVLEWKDYETYILYMMNTYAPVVPGSGMNGFAIAAAVRRYCIKYRIPMTISWKGFMDDQQMLRVMRKMLKEDIPVILAVGPNTPLVFRGKGIPFYTWKEKKEFILSNNSSVHSHFVVVTGILGFKHKRIMLQISSWGQEYYIDYEEYRKYIQEEGDTLTSSLLYLSKEDGTLF